MAQQYLNKKQELFAKFVAEGCTQFEAYELAGYEPSSANACTLASRPLVKRRIEELREEHDRREAEFRVLAHQAEKANPEVAKQIAMGVEWTFQRVMDMMGDNVRLAQVAGEYKAANECLKMMGESLKMLEGAKSKQVESAQGASLTFVKNLTHLMGSVQADEITEEDEEPQNPLRPTSNRRGAGKVKKMDDEE